MLSIKTKILILCLSVSFSGFSVNELNKVEELFKALKYEKSYKKAYKLKGESAYYKKSKTYYFIGFSLLNLSKESAKKLGVSYRDKIIVQNVAKGLKYQKTNNEINRFNSFIPSFKKIAKARLLSAKKSRKEKEWKDISKMLATHFLDTVTEYWEAFPIKIKKEKKENIEKKKETIEIKESSNQPITLRQDSILNWAKTYIGTPYLYAGESRKGIDCSGFTSTILNRFGAQLPHSAKLQSTKGKKVKSYQVGDIAFFGYQKKGGSIKISHVGIIISNYPKPLKVIHATSSLGVRIDNISKSSYWKPKYLYSVRVL